MNVPLPDHKSEQTGNPVLDRIQNNVRALFATVRALILVQPVSVMLPDTFTTTSANPVATKLSFPVKAHENWRVDLHSSGSCSSVNGMGYALGAPPGSTVDGYLESSSTNTLVANWLVAQVATVGAGITPCHVGASDAARPDRMSARVQVGAQDGQIVIMIYAVNGGTARIYKKAHLGAWRVTEVAP